LSKIEESIVLHKQSNLSSYQNWGIKHPSSQKPPQYTPLAMHIQSRKLHGAKESSPAGAQQQVESDLSARHRNLLINQPPLLIKPSIRRLAPPLQHNTIHLKPTS